jgi:hypothetical protein
MRRVYRYLIAGSLVLAACLSTEPRRWVFATRKPDGIPWNGGTLQLGDTLRLDFTATLDESAGCTNERAESKSTVEPQAFSSTSSDPSVVFVVSTGLYVMKAAGQATLTVANTPTGAITAYSITVEPKP